MSSMVVLLQHGVKAVTGVDPGLSDQGWEQVRRAAAVLAAARPTMLVSSPLIRARESIQPLSQVTGLSVGIDGRVRERLEFDPQVWDSRTAFLDDWEHTTSDRDFIPASGDSSHAAAMRLRDAVVDHAGSGRRVVIATHGGVTLDLLRTIAIAGDQAVELRFLSEGMPNGHLTTLVVAGEGIEVASIGLDPMTWATRWTNS